ncbi:MAG: phytanoyl-CoA dioxygenase family protein [bacterium]
MNDANINDEIIARFWRDGVVCLRGVFDQHWLDQLAAGVEANFADPGPYHTRYTDADAPGGFYDDYCNWQRIAQYRDFILHSPAGEIAARILRSNAVRIYHEHVLIKEPGTREKTPWHHDLPYYGLSGAQLGSIWLPLDEVPQDVCPQFVAGSHRNGALYYPRLFRDHQDYRAENSDDDDGFQSVPDIDAAIANGSDQPRILSWRLRRGDCLVFHMRSVHGAPATRAMKSRRRGFSTRWLGDDARFAQRPWTTSPPFPELRLKPGEAMDDPAFPLVWRRQPDAAAR